MTRDAPSRGSKSRRRTIFEALSALVENEAERRALEETFLRTQQLETMGHLARGAAHDFNNLLTVVRCYSEFIISASAHDDPRRRDAEEISRAAQHAAHLTRQLLSFSRSTPRHARVVDLNRLVRDFAPMIVRIVGEDIRLSLTLADDPYPVLIDPGQMQQVLMNLAANARDAMPNGGTLTIDVSYKSNETELRDTGEPFTETTLTVSDTGVGIPHEEQANIFEPFFTSKGPESSAGLGLAAVQSIVTQWRGSVRVHSELGEGAAFEVVLPCASARDLAVENGGGHQVLTGAETIVVVEDDARMLEPACRALEDLGYTVLGASSGDEAVRMAASHGGPIDAVIADIIMPGMSGPACVARLQNSHPDIRVLYMSGHSDDRVEQYGILAERHALLRKPFGPEALAAALRAVIDD